MTTDAGTTLSCSDSDCGCRVRVEVPCPHGDTYTCACGHELVADTSGGDIPPTPGA